MKFAKALYEFHNIFPFNINKGDIFQVVKEGPETEEYGICEGFVSEGYVQEYYEEFEFFDSEPKQIFIAKQSDGKWIEVTKNEEEAFRSLGKETKILYGV